MLPINVNHVTHHLDVWIAQQVPIVPCVQLDIISNRMLPAPRVQILKPALNALIQQFVYSVNLYSIWITRLSNVVYVPVFYLNAKTV